jgi:hypothetical protein
MPELYFCPRVVRRLQSNTDSTVLERLLTDLHSRGYACNMIQNYVGAAEVSLRWLLGFGKLFFALSCGPSVNDACIF